MKTINTLGATAVEVGATILRTNDSSRSSIDTVSDRIGDVCSTSASEVRRRPFSGRPTRTIAFLLLVTLFIRGDDELWLRRNDDIAMVT